MSETSESTETTEGAQARQAAETAETTPGQGPSTSPEARRITGGSDAAGPAEQAGKLGRNPRKVREGYVRSDRMQKTVVVALEDRKKHPLYGKIMRFTQRVKAHDEQDAAGVGDRVLLMETRPLGATKRWRLVQILERAK